MYFKRRLLMMISSVCLFNIEILADSAQLLMIKDQISQLEQRGDAVPADLYEMAKQLEVAEQSNSANNQPTDRSCNQNLIGTWENSGKDKIYVLNANGLGYFIEYSVSGESYQSRVEFKWTSSQDAITFNYTSDLIATNLETGMVSHKTRLENGAKSCRFTSTVLVIDGSAYYP